jgi:hypothetical protein
VTGIPPRCVAIACPYAPRIPGLPGPVPDDARLSGMPGLRFRTIADMITLPWHGWKDTANAVGLYGPPGFKSPILRSSQALSRNLQGRAWLIGSPGLQFGLQFRSSWPYSASLIRSLASFI